jgi:hypothetical protein
VTDEDLDRRVTRLEHQVAALEHAAAQATPEDGDPVAAGFEAYRRRAHAIEERRERKEQGA